MQKEESLLEMRARRANLEAELWQMRTSRKLWRRGVVSASAPCLSFSLLAQTFQRPLTLQSLAKRVTDLEKRVANDEASRTNIPQTADTGTTPGKPAFGSAASHANAALQQRVSALETKITGLVDSGIQQRFGNDELRLGHVERTLAMLQSKASSSPNSNSARNSSSILDAPFEVVGGNGKVSLAVEEDAGGGDFRVFAPDGSTALIATPSGRSFGVSLDGSDGKTATAGMFTDKEGTTIGVLSGDHVRAEISTPGGLGCIGVPNDKGQYLAALTSYPGAGGALQIGNPSGQLLSIVDSDPATNQGRAIFTDAGGQPLAKIGAAGRHGDLLLGGKGKGFEVWGPMIARLP